MAVRPSVRACVRPSTKNFFDCNEIWHVGRGRWVMHDIIIIIIIIIIITNRRTRVTLSWTKTLLEHCRALQDKPNNHVCEWRGYVTLVLLYNVRPSYFGDPPLLQAAYICSRRRKRWRLSLGFWIRECTALSELYGWPDQFATGAAKQRKVW